MRILHISSARSLGGGERHLADLANALAVRGHEVFVALTAGSPLRDELSELPAQNIFTLRLRNALDIGSALELSRLVRRHQIEVLHAHVARDYPLAALATKRNRQTKFFITRHVLFPLNGLHAVTLSHVSGVIAVSHAAARALAARKIIPADKVIVIPNGIDISRFDADLQSASRDTLRRRLNLDPKTLIIGSVGDIKRQKGHQDFLLAAARIAGQHSDVHFIVAGADTTRRGDHLKTLKALVAVLRLNDRVHFTGWVEDTAPLLAAFDVYVSASRTESFGLSIVEAMASGLPVIATATEGAKEILGSNSTGVLVPVGDIEGLTASTLGLIADPAERTRLGTEARNIARTRFSLERMVNETEKAYREVRNDER